jgi:hypothetical protein
MEHVCLRKLLFSVSPNRSRSTKGNKEHNKNETLRSISLPQYAHDTEIAGDMSYNDSSIHK